MKLPSLLRTPPPQVTLDIGPGRVAAVMVSGTHRGLLKVERHAIEPLSADAIVPSLTAANLVRPAEVVQAIERVWDRLRIRPTRVALVVPDAVAKVSIVRFQNVPARPADLEEMIRFQIRKAAPFRLEESQVSFERGALTPEGQEFVVVQARRDVVTEYERACEAAGAIAGHVDVSTFNVANAVLAADLGPAGDWLLIHSGPDHATLAIYRGSHLVFFRHRGAEGDGHLSDLVHQTAMYYQDRLGGLGFSRVLGAGPALLPGGGSISRTVETRVGIRIEPIDLSRAVDVGGSRVLTGEVLDTLTPAIGLALAQRPGS